LGVCLESSAASSLRFRLEWMISICRRKVDRMRRRRDHAHQRMAMRLEVRAERNPGGRRRWRLDAVGMEGACDAIGRREVEGERVVVARHGGLEGCQL
jgi:hypothetical protein